ncbi:hypothetical protein EDB83DRAFT_2534619 [Lactarius deliciosus]|nr:hypothetical protein EDB83DRAFT_2534619 [Lactarius deliciosus]
MTGMTPYMMKWHPCMRLDSTEALYDYKLISATSTISTTETIAVHTSRHELLHMHRRSMYLIGRDHTVEDIPLEHASCSKQHVVIHEASSEFESTNGTHVSEAIPTSRYSELKAIDSARLWNVQ